MGKKCKATTDKGKRRKRNALPNEEYCKGRLYPKSGGKYKKTSLLKKPEFIIGTFLALFCIFLAFYFGFKGVTKKELSQTKKELPQMVGAEFEKRLEDSGILPPKTYEEIRKAIGKSCTEVGEALCNKIRTATEDLENGKYAEAEQSYEALTKLFPDVAELHFNLASSFYYQGKLTETLKELRKAIKINPNDPSTINNLGIVLYDLKRYPEADSEYKKAIRIDPNFAEAHNNLGCLYKIVKKKGEAKKELLIARELFEKQNRTKDVKKIDGLLKDLE